jgi:hypothetical protein
VYYRACLTFHPNQANRVGISRRGVWRVWHAYYTTVPSTTPYVGDHRGRKCMFIAADRLYKKGSRVEPRRVVLAALALEGGLPRGNESAVPNK